MTTTTVTDIILLLPYHTTQSIYNCWSIEDVMNINLLSMIQDSILRVTIKVWYNVQERARLIWGHSSIWSLMNEAQ